METVSLLILMSHHTAVVHNCRPHHHYLHLPRCLLIAQVQEVVSGEKVDMCGRQHDSDHWLALSHDPVVMGGRVMHQISQVACTKAGYPSGRRRMNNFFFIAFHYAA